ncbi:branched-chain amino acid ABC transporter permease [Natronorubrum texcoconense]|uniref:Amino acid/amide ABC transporter membrane protein 1, HAAT family n=1 Tax=Natronorubrum texcoconense TaxID=1095776 RepID=A0A1G9D6X1_9EURY|nr:branched-chain amino acid ABC transporter permease [Natronorubrum texcoconense]SDK59591.1 amino acid/amide ABC transporter membrane protein 1, HAAT family [Natronorubrum texcoconense]
MVDIVGIAANTIILGSLYALIAVGFTLVFGVAGQANLAHGATITIGAFTAWFVAGWGGGVWIGLLAGTVAGAVFHVLLYQVFVRHIDDPINVLILTLLAWFVIEYSFRAGIGSEPRSVPSLLAGSTSIGSVSLLYNNLLIFVLSWVFIGALFVFVNHTKRGQAIIATSMNEKGAALVGIKTGDITLLTWGVAGLLAGSAGVLYGSFRAASYDMGMTPLVLAFAIVILGGIGSIRGSLVAAYIIGFLEVFTTSAISPRLSGMTALLVVVVVLLVRPTGLYGRELPA